MLDKKFFVDPNRQNPYDFGPSAEPRPSAPLVQQPVLSAPFQPYQQPMLVENTWGELQPMMMPAAGPGQMTLMTENAFGEMRPVVVPAQTLRV